MAETSKPATRSRRALVPTSRRGGSDDLFDQGIDSLRRQLGWSKPEVRVLASIQDRLVFEARMGSEKLIVKVELADFRADREYRAICLAREHGLPVPEIVYWNSGSPSVLAYRPVSGLSLVQVDTEAAWNDAGRLLRRIHELPVQGIRPFDWKGNGWTDFARLWLAQSLQWLPETGLMTDLEIERLTNIGWAGMEGAEVRPRRFLHGDCQPLHYLVDAAANQISGIIDLGDAGTGDPLWDIATICVNRARRPWLLAGYGDVDAGPESLGALLDSYYVLRHVSAVGWLIENDLDTKPSVDLLRQIIADG